MVDLTVIARPYAQAIYEYAKTNNTTAQWNIMLLNLSECILNKGIKLLLDNPLYSQSDISKLIFEVLGDMLDKYGKNFVKLTAEHRRLVVIPTIYKLFLSYKAEDEKAKKARVTTALKISSAEIEKLQKKLEQKYQCVVEIEVAVDASLIGGATIEIDDHIIDGSIKGQLQKLKYELQA